MAVGLSASFVPHPENLVPGFWWRGEEGELVRSQETRGHRAAPKSSWQQLGGLGPCDLPRFRRACGCAAIAMS